MMAKTNGLLATLSALVLLGCGLTDPFGPIDGEEVHISFEISGGIAGLVHTLEVDGAEGVARYVCASCSPREERTLPLSAAQIEHVALLLEEGGVFAIDGTDFGTECCDQFSYDLTYRRGDLVSRATGTDVLWPRELIPALSRLSALTMGDVPLLFEPDANPSAWPRDALSLEGFEVVGQTLRFDVSYGGGCAEHRMDLVAFGGWLESFPVQINAFISHDDSDDPCRAIVQEPRSFSLRPLTEAYEASYGPIGAGRPTVILRIHDPNQAEPITIEVVL